MEYDENGNYELQPLVLIVSPDSSSKEVLRTDSGPLVLLSLADGKGLISVNPQYIRTMSADRSGGCLIQFETESVVVNGDYRVLSCLIEDAMTSGSALIYHYG